LRFSGAARDGALTKELKRVRAIFIGHGEAGKTSLIRALHGEDVIQGKEPRPGKNCRSYPMGARLLRISVRIARGGLVLRAHLVLRQRRWQQDRLMTRQQTCRSVPRRCSDNRVPGGIGCPSRYLPVSSPLAKGK
jgi:hypothetical protein